MEDNKKIAYLLVETCEKEIWDEDSRTTKRILSVYETRESAEAALKHCKPISIICNGNAFPTQYSIEEKEIGMEIPNPEITENDLREVGCYLSLADYPVHLRTRELCLAAVMRSTMERWGERDEQLRHVPESVCDAEICIAAVKRFLTEPDEYIDDDETWEQYSKSEITNSEIWNYVPEHLKKAVLKALNV